MLNVVEEAKKNSFMVTANLAGEVVLLNPPAPGQKLDREEAQALALRLLRHVYPECRTVGEVIERLQEMEAAG